MKIEDIEIDKLKPAEYNPRQMTEKQVEDLTKSIKEFGLVDPIICNKDLTIIGGHQRVRIAKRLNHKTVPVYFVDLNKEKEKELNLRLNKNLGEWDWDILTGFDTDLLKGVGFNDNDFNLSIDKYGEDFELSSGDKQPFQQITFTLSDKQAGRIIQAIKDAKIDNGFGQIETNGNENQNGNALFLIVSQWLTSRT